MQKRLTFSAIIVFLFLLFAVAITYGGTQFFLEYRILMLLASLSAIVIFLVLTAFVLGHGDKVGYVFLGSVVFKMFGVGYLAVFQRDFKEHVIGYFVIFWIYLMIEALITVVLVRKHDINHKNQNPQVFDTGK